MAESKINSPGAMKIGDSAATTSVTLGKTGALSVSNSTTPPTITVTGTVTGSLDSKSYYVSVRNIPTVVAVPSGPTPTLVTFIDADQAATNFPFTLGTSTFTIPATGTYIWNARCGLLPGTTGLLECGFVIGGEDPLVLFGPFRCNYAVADTPNMLQTTMIRKFTAGATVQFAVRQFTGGACTIDNGDDFEFSLTAYRSGP